MNFDPPDELDFAAPEEEKDLGVLSHPPAYQSLMPLALIYLGIALCSGFYWRGAKWLAASYGTVFIDGQVYQLLTSLLVHADIGHILGNTPMLVIFGYYLHGYYGNKIFPIACLILGIVTNIVTLHYMPPAVRLVGASGMVYAMVGLWLVYYIKFEVRFSLAIRILRALGFAIAVMFPSTYFPEVSYRAHAVGFGLGLLFGLVSMFFVSPKAIDRTTLHT